MPRTPSREASQVITEGLKLDATIETPVPGQTIYVPPGTLRFINGKFVAQDNVGGYDLRFGQLNVEEHEAAQTLGHNIFQNSYTEITRVQGRLQSIVVWKNASRLIKIRETVITRVNSQITSIEITQYNPAGAVYQKNTQTVSRNPTTGQVISLNGVLT